MLIKSKYPRNKIEKCIENTLRTTINNNDDKKEIDNNQSLTTNKEITVKQKQNIEEKYLCTITMHYIPHIEILERKLEKLNVKFYLSYPNK